MALESMIVEIGITFPVVLILYSNGTVALAPRIAEFSLYDDVPQGISGVFTEEDFALRQIGVDEFDRYVYNVPYVLSKLPTLKAWLVQQKLVWPLNN